MKKIIFLAMLLPNLSIAQQPKALEKIKAPPAIIKPLQIGDTIPDALLSSILNYPSSQARLSAFKGKLILLDFFASWCGSCLHELPRIDSLQRQFPDNLQVLMIAYESPAVIKKFMTTSKVAKGVAVPFVTGDTMFSKWFPHRMLPHLAWVDAAGKLVAITKSKHATPENIRATLAGQMPDLPVKADVMSFDRSQPLLSEKNGGTPNDILYQSTITRHIPGIPGMNGISYSPDSTTKRIYFTNHTIISLYLAALGHQYSNKVLLRVKDPSSFIPPVNTDDTWAGENNFCYEAYVPAGTSTEAIKQGMLTSLNRYFGLQAVIENRLVHCYALQNSPGGFHAIASNEKIPLVEFAAPGQPYYIFQNQPVQVLVDAINNQVTTRPYSTIVLNETNINGNIDIRFKSPLNVLPQLSKSLQPFGLQLVQVQRELPMLVISAM